MSFLGLSQVQWTALAAIAGFALAAAAIATIIVTVCMARTDRTRDDDKRHEDRAHDADLRRQDREREDQLRSEADKTWERRRVAEELHARRSVAAGSQPVLELQAQELTESLAERKREADERHRAQAAQVFISVTTFPDNATGAALIEAMQ